MLKLPVCPYCKAIYRYGDIKNLKKKKECVCHNCKRKFEVSYLKGRIIILSVVAVLLIAINLLMFNFLDSITITGCLILTATFITVTFLLFPFTVRFRKIPGEEKKEPDNKNGKKMKKSQKVRKIKSDR